MIPKMVFFLCLFLLGCNADSRLTVSADDAESRKLHTVFDQYFEQFLQMFPLFATSIGDRRYDDQLSIAISEEHRGRQRELYVKSLAWLGHVKSERLGPEDRLNYALFERLMTLRIEGLKLNQHLQPIRQLASTAVEFPLIGSGAGVHPFKTTADYDRFLKRIERFRPWVDTAIANMRRGIELGVVQPRAVIERTLPQLEAMIVADPKQSLFFQPILQIPDAFPESDKHRLAQAYTRAIAEQIVPTYRKLCDFIRQEYLPNTRATVAISDLPDGAAWYDYRVKTQTTTHLAADDIFHLGMSEIERIRKEIERIRGQSGFDGSISDFGSYLAVQSPAGFRNKQDLIRAYESIHDKVAPQLGRLFVRLPKARFEIRTVEEFREKSASSQYQPASPDGSRPGIFYVNAGTINERPARASEALFLHEAMPGHHFQISLQREHTRLPRFRRFGGYAAFVEGWALYAETLGSELGLYKDPYQYYSRLNSELFRAVRLVVDVGLHRKGWTRAQAIAFMMKNTRAGEAGASREVDRYIARPAQALAYKIGQLKISAIRTKAEKALGARFDIRDFHEELLKDGGLPLDLLEAKMDAWISSRLNTAAQNSYTHGRSVLLKIRSP